MVKQNSPKLNPENKEMIKRIKKKNNKPTYMNKERKRGLISVKETENTLD